MSEFEADMVASAVTQLRLGPISGAGIDTRWTNRGPKGLLNGRKLTCLGFGGLSDVPQYPSRVHDVSNGQSPRL